MRHVLCRLTLAAAMAAAVAACDGGSSGTGISTSALGNVASVNTASRPAPDRARPTMIARLLGGLGFEREAFARAPLEGIRVTIEGTTLSTQTDAEGRFALRGNFAGPIPMAFEPPDGGRSSLAIVVPRGGELTLTDVRLDGRTGTATADGQHVRFGGLVNSTDCPQNSATMVSRETPGDGNRYTVLLSSATVRDSSGQPLACSNLFAGQSADVDGEVGHDGEVEAHSVEVESESEDRSGPGKGGPAGAEDNSGKGSSSDDGGKRGSGGSSGEVEDGGKGGSSGSGGDDGGSGGEGSGHG